MNLKDYIVSDEIQSAMDAGHEMLSTVTTTSHFWLKQAVAIFVPILLGAFVSYFLIAAFITEPEPEQLKNLSSTVSNGMTVITVLAGFTVTLMLFTGRTSNTKSLTADTAREYSDRVTYLLFSQSLTLVIHVVSIAACLSWSFMQALEQEQLASPIMLSFTGGLVFLSFLRTLLLPLQIYDVHHFELSAMVEEKDKEFEGSLKDSDQD